MSSVANRIAHFWIKHDNPDFLTAASDFTPEDQPLIDNGVFTLSKATLTAIPCPFGCGDIEQIHTLPRPNGKGTMRCIECKHGKGHKELSPRDYQLYAFNPNAALQYAQTIKSINEEEQLKSAGETIFLVRPNETTKDKMRFLRELVNLIYIHHHQRYGLHSIFQTVEWIYGEHKPSDPYFNEIVIAQKIRNGGRKRKNLRTMYSYARQGKASNLTLLKLIAAKQKALKLQLHKEELAEIAKIDPREIRPVYDLDLD